jgi:hypothetical protein
VAQLLNERAIAAEAKKTAALSTGLSESNSSEEDSPIKPAHPYRAEAFAQGGHTSSGQEHPITGIAPLISAPIVTPPIPPSGVDVIPPAVRLNSITVKPPSQTSGTQVDPDCQILNASTISWTEEGAKARAEAQEHRQAAKRYEAKVAESEKNKAAAENSSRTSGKSSRVQTAKTTKSSSEDSRAGSGLQTIIESDGDSYKPLCSTEC